MNTNCEEQTQAPGKQENQQFQKDVNFWNIEEKRWKQKKKLARF